MNTYNNLFKDFNDNYILYIPLSIILQSCIGSIAAMFILMNSTATSFHFFQLTLCVVVSMSYNAAIFAQLKNKFVFNSLIVALVVNIMLIIVNVWIYMS
ncbi:hypothetical protein [Gaetbulibacter sp. PBL-D1]|uniref:hypothetical protein n=1 Tax=Gaetbulibacter sp. PBL-D1 TaxID=3422594 RepID=UPI003D2EF599